MASIRNSVSTRPGTVVSNTTAAAGTLKSCGKSNQRVINVVEFLNFPSERNAEGRPERGLTSASRNVSLEILDPTETDVTETTRPEDEEGLIREVKRSHSLFSIEVLIERLREVNCDDGELSRFQTRSTERGRFGGDAPLLSVEEMTQLLMHVNLCEQEESSLPPPTQRIAVATSSSSSSPDRWKHHRTQSSCRKSALLKRSLTDVTDTTTLPSPSNENQQVESRSFSAHHSPLIPLSELMDRLVRGNPGFSSSSETKLSHMLQRKSKSAISLEEMTRILHHINCSCSEAVGSAAPPNAIGKKDECILQARSADSSPKPYSGKICSRRRACRSLCGSNISRPSSSSSCWTEFECETATIDMKLLSGEDGHSPLAAIELHACGDDDDDDDDGSGFSLNASLHSCGSSVTWYEGSDIDEISIDDEISMEDDDEHEEILLPMRVG